MGYDEIATGNPYWGRNLPMRRTALGLSTVLAAAFLTGCGGSDEPAAETTPVEPSSSSPAPSKTASKAPEPTVTAKPLSPYEDEKPVQVARAWAGTYAEAINDGQQQLEMIRPLTTPGGMTRFPDLGAEDQGLLYPGPLPFTPTDVDVSGNRAEIAACTWVEGFAQDRATKQPPKPRLIAPSTFVLLRSGGSWKVDDLAVGQGDCASVPVKGIGF